MDITTTVEQRLESDESFRSRVSYSNIPIATCRNQHLYHFVQRRGTEAAYQAALDFVAGKAKHHFLTLVGPPGTGKTHLAVGIGWHWLDNDLGLVKYFQVEALLDELRRGFHADTDDKLYDFEQVMKRVKEVKLLILDDLGAEQSTPWARSKLDMIVDHRYLNGLALVVTTNLSPEQLEPRIADRLSEGVVAVLEADSYRKIKGRVVNRRESAVGISLEEDRQWGSTAETKESEGRKT